MLTGACVVALTTACVPAGMLGYGRAPTESGVPEEPGPASAVASAPPTTSVPAPRSPGEGEAGGEGAAVGDGTGVLAPGGETTVTFDDGSTAVVPDEPLALVERPPGVDALDDDGAMAAGYYFVATLQAGRTRGDLSELRPLHSPGCQGCASFEAGVAELAAQGAVVRGGDLTPVSASADPRESAPDDPAQRVVVLRFESEPMFVLADTSLIAADPAGVRSAAMVMHHDGSRWMVDEAQFVLEE